VSTVDVVVPCYNYAHYLKGCVDSLLSQRGVDVRVLIIDDASRDHTPAVAEQLAAMDQRVSYVRNQVNIGLVGTANKGVMGWATAEYVVLLSADDALTQGSLARATTLLDARPDVALFYGPALTVLDDGPELEVADPLNPGFAVVPSDFFLRRICEYGNFVPTPCAIMRTSVQRRIGGYNSLFKHTSDLDMWMRAGAVGSVGVVNAIQGLYRWHGSNMSAAYHSRLEGDRAEMLATCKEFCKNKGKDFPEFAEWLEQMERRLGDEIILNASKSFETLGDTTWRAALQLGKSYRRDYWKSALWWKFLLKRIVGRRATELVQHVEDTMRLRSAWGRSRKPAAWCDHGMQYGWWPENFRIPTA
jgi:glycosyltransferase involved in cell wall biosynthesis